MKLIFQMKFVLKAHSIRSDGITCLLNFWTFLSLVSIVWGVTPTAAPMLFKIYFLSCMSLVFCSFTMRRATAAIVFGGLPCM